jgi:DNA-binding NarL/FixJ family response regulator
MTNIDPAQAKGLGVPRPQPNPITVYIVEDEQIYLEGLQIILRPDPEIEVLGSHTYFEGAAEEIERAGPHVALIDVRLLERDGGKMLVAGGLEVLEQIKGRMPQVKCLLITGYDSPEYVEYFLKAIWLGAEGFALKNPSQWQGHGNRIANMIKAVIWGSGYYEPQFVRELAAVADESLLPVVPYMGSLSLELTEREREVVEMLQRGLTNREIADRLFTTENTIKSHVHNVMGKFKVDKRAKLVRLLSNNTHPMFGRNPQSMGDA